MLSILKANFLISLLETQATKSSYQVRFENATITFSFHRLPGSNAAVRLEQVSRLREISHY